MKISGYKFGHPVFGLEDYYDFRPEVAVEQKIEDGHLIITSSNFELGDNQKLKELLNNDVASIVTEVFCTYTMYRKSFFSKDGINVRVPLENLKNKLEILYFIIANEQLDNYTNDAVKPSLRNQSFFVEKGDILGLLGEEILTLDVSTSMDSIVKIRKSDNNQTHTFSWNESSIIINLPPKQHTKLNKFKASLEYQKILVSSVLQSALIHACYKLKADSQYSEKNWHKALLIHWQNYNKQSESPSVEEIPEFVEHLLKKPFGLLIDTIEEVDHKIRNIQE
ncbi:hypothetical protein [Algibacter sp. 2305UL17-15]|uniref:hypothetical protein n=1 Tax=Algibacter sp. 2305UL17-15 TaxID=3231268 RepID=UPI0034581F61